MIEKPEYRIRITAFKAMSEVEKCEVYLKGHTKVLTDYNVMKITSYNKSWMKNPSAYIIIAENEDTGEMIGGIRVEVAKGLFPLPIETAIGTMDERVYSIVQDYAIHGGVGELCGLWNSKTVKGLGISFFLTRAAISIVDQLKFKTMVGICAEYTLKMFTDVGFVINTEVGDNGKFPYPDDRYITRALGILNAETLETASLYDKERVVGLREYPVQVRLESGSKGIVEVNYDLVVKNVDNLVYKSKL